MRRGPDPGKVVELRAEVVTVGRGTKCDIVVLDNEVSRLHCRFIKVMEDYELQDLESANGTFVNGQRVQQGWLLKSDCIIELGDMITFQFERTFETTLAQEPVALPAVGKNAEDETHEAYAIPANQPFLIITRASSPDEPEITMLIEDQFNIGRDPSNHIAIEGPEVSRYHLRLTRADAGYVAEDLGSTNGTIYNEQPLTAPVLLQTDDVLQIGSSLTLLYTTSPHLYRSLAQTNYLDDAQRPPERRRPEAGGADTTEPYRAPFARLITGSKRRTSQLGTGLNPGDLEDHLFLAYAREDWEPMVAPLLLGLQDARLRVWVDQYLKLGHQDWMLAVQQALTECWLLLVVVSPDALHSESVVMQYRYFFNREKPIIPVLYHFNSTLPPEMARLRTVRFDENDRTRSTQRLIFEIMEHRRARG